MKQETKGKLYTLVQTVEGIELETEIETGKRIGAEIELGTYRDRGRNRSSDNVCCRKREKRMNRGRVRNYSGRN